LLQYLGVSKAINNHLLISRMRAATLICWWCAADRTSWRGSRLADDPLRGRFSL